MNPSKRRKAGTPPISIDTHADKISFLKKGERAAELSTLAAILLLLSKGLVGILSGSIALLADAVHSLSDVFVCVAVWVGLRLAQKKPTEEFPYGYYKAETLASLGVSVAILISGVQIILESGKRFASPSPISFAVLALLVAGYSAAFSYLISQYKQKAGKAINSQALIGDGKHSMIDVYLSLTVFAGIVFSHFGTLWIEPLASLLIGIVLVKFGIGLAKDTGLILMDACLKPDHISQMKATAETVQGVKGVHGVRMRRSGPYVFGEMHVEVEEKASVEKAHQISEAIERKIKDTIKEIDSLIIHVEPAEAEAHRVAVPVSGDKGMESTFSHHLGGAPYFLFIDIDRGHIVNWFVSKNPGTELQRKRGLAAAKFLIEHKTDALLTKEIGEGPFHVLRDSSVKIYKILDSSDIKQILKALEKKELEPVISAG